MVIPYGHKLFRPRIAKHSPKLLIHDEERIPCWWMAVQKGALEMCVGATFTCDEETPWRMIAYKWPNHHTSFTKSTNCPAQLSSALRLLSGLYGIDYSSLCVFTVQRCLSISPLFSVQD